MSRRRTTVLSGMLLSLVVFGGLSRSAMAWQETAPVSPDTLLPARPLLLFSFDGLQRQQNAGKETGTPAGITNSGVIKALGELLDLAILEIAEPAFELARKLGARGFQQGASVSLTLGIAHGLPAPQLTVVLHNGAEYAPLLTELAAEPLKSFQLQTETISQRQVTRLVIPKTPGYEVGWWSGGGHLTIVAGGNAVAAAIAVAEGKAPNLTRNVAVKELRTAADFKVVAIAYIDVKTLVSLVRNFDIPTGAMSGKPPVKMEDILQATGLDGVTSFKSRWGLREDAFCSEAVLEAPAPRRGILSLLDQRAFTLAELPCLPKGCEHFSMSRLDASKLTATVIGLIDQGVRAFGPEGAPAVSEVLARVKSRIGFDPVADLANHFGDTLVCFVDPDAPGVLPAIAFMANVDDAAKLEQTFSLLEQKAEAAWGHIVKFRVQEFGGRRIHVTLFSEPVAWLGPVWVLDKDWLIVGTTLQTVEAHLSRVDGKLDCWKVPEELVERLRGLPEKVISIRYSDPRWLRRWLMKYLPEGVELAEGMVRERRSNKARKSEQKLDDAPKLSVTEGSDADAATKPRFPNIRVISVDDQGIKWFGRHSLPVLTVP